MAAVTPGASRVADLLTQALRAASGLGVDLTDPEWRAIVKTRDRLLEPKQGRLP